MQVALPMYERMGFRCHRHAPANRGVCTYWMCGGRLDAMV